MLVVPFTLLPAVDVSDGRAARVTGGDAASEADVGDALGAARAWQRDGADWLHLVDLDAAFGRGTNASLLRAIVADVDMQVQWSGGVHHDSVLEVALASGCDRVVISTAALNDLDWCARVIAKHGPRIAVALDVRIEVRGDGAPDYRLAPRGGGGDVGGLWNTIRRLDADGCARYLITDVSRDGSLDGPNIDLYQSVTRVTGTPVIASGGIATLADLHALARIPSTPPSDRAPDRATGRAPDRAVHSGSLPGDSTTNRTRPVLEGAIVGKALYSGRFTLPAALARVAAEPGDD